MQRFQKASLLAGTIMAGAMFAAPAYAQTETAEVSESTTEVADAIVVTGSRIADSNLQLANPVVSISAEEFSLQAPASVEQVLRDLPGSAPGVGAQVNNGNGGVATFNLRGLGSNRNLVLLNNRRVVPSTLGSVVDLNVIPIALIERAEVLTGGAVTTYGADAIAGVVNFSTKQDFEGVNITMVNGITERGDGRQFRIDGVIGGNFGDGRGNVVVGLGYTKTEPVLQGERQIGLVSRGSTCAAGLSNDACTALQVGSAQGSATATPASLLSPLPTTGAFAGGAQFGGSAITPGLADFNFNPLNLFQAPLERYNIYTQGSYEIAPGIETYAEAFYTRTTVVTELAPTGTFFSPLEVPLNNPFLTATMRDQLCSFAGIADCAAAISSGREITTLLGRRFTESGPRRNDNNSNVFQITAGVRGALTDTLSFDVFGQYGQADRRNTASGGALGARVQQALRATSTTACRDTAGGCVPLNLFGPDGSITPQMLAFIGVPTSTFVETSFESVQGIISGDLGFSSPFAESPIGIAIGAEYRRYAGLTFGDLPTATAGAILGAGGAVQRTEGSFHSNEIFGEVIVPLVEDKPFAHLLQLDGGFRYSDFNTTGGNWTFKGGAQWAPIEDIKFRAAWTRAIRSPNIGELFSPANTVLNNLAVDPCQGASGTANATVTALCAAQLAAVGTPAGRLGSIPAPIAGQINVTGGGNPALQPETATTWTAGAVFQPRFLDGFVASVDWYRVNVRDAVSSPTVSDVVNGCFGQSNPNFALCQLIRRDSITGGLSGSPASVQGVLLFGSNLGFIQNEGVDFTANYTHELGDVVLDWNVNANHTMRNRFQSQPASFIRECQGFYSVSCDGAMIPDWSFNMRTTARYEGVDVSLLWRYISGFEYEPRETIGGAPLTTTQNPAGQTVVGSFGSANPARIVGGYREIDSFNWFDLNVGFSVTEELRLSLLVENLFDRGAPDVGNTIGSTSFNSGNTFPSVYDALGRRYTLTLGVQF
jgi:outer membrane receptor protein involved in Fe transport